MSSKQRLNVGSSQRSIVPPGDILMKVIGDTLSPTIDVRWVEIPSQTGLPDPEPIGVGERNVEVNAVVFRYARAGLRGVQLVQPHCCGQYIRVRTRLNLRLCPAEMIQA